MFTDKRSKSLILLAHCILNQNAKSDGTASYGGCITELTEIINKSNIGIIQMPCPELHCLGLDRGDKEGASRPVVEENSRIREEIIKTAPLQKIHKLIQHLLIQIEEYQKHGFCIQGVIGINRSPSCGVDTTSKNNQEIQGQGVFIEELQKELHKRDIHIPFIGIKVFEPEQAILRVTNLLSLN